MNDLVSHHSHHIGQIIQGKVSSMAAGGLGIIRDQGLVIFVPFTIEDEIVEVEIIALFKNYASGKLKKLIESSPFRVQPKCPVYGRCGGCQLQHMHMDKQLEFKQKMIQESFHKIAKMDLPLFPITATSSPWGYRRHIRVKRKGPNIGFIGIDNRSFIEIDHCPIFSFEKLELEPGQRVVLKSKLLEMEVFGLSIHFSPQAFLQNNEEQSHLIYKKVYEKIMTLQPKKVLDLYCGIGIMSLLIAREGIKTLGIELNPTAIELAKKNAVLNHISCSKFISSSVEKCLPGLKDYEIVIVNPPREGLDPIALEALKLMGPKDIFYISCMPQTLARDVERLGYRIENGYAFDMFPQTMHVETLVHLKKI